MFSSGLQKAAGVLTKAAGFKGGASEKDRSGGRVKHSDERKMKKPLEPEHL